MFSDFADLSWTTIASANYGLTIQWKPPQATSWLANFIKNTISIAVGFVPFIGPLAAVAFPLAWTAIADPESFEGTLRAMVPAADIAMHIRDEIQKSSKEQQSYLPKEWAKASKGIAGLLAPPATTPAPKAATKVPAIDEVQRKATLQKIESVRKFKYGNVLKPAGQSVAEKPKEKATVSLTEPAPSKETVPLEPPRNISLDKVGPSPMFQLAAQVLGHSGDNAALKSHATGAEDDKAGAVLEEVIPEGTLASEELAENFYDWTIEYLQSEAWNRM